MNRLWIFAVFFSLVLAGCGSDSSSDSGAPPDSPPSTPPPPPPPPSVGTGGSGGTAGSFGKATVVDGVSRTYTLYVPTSAMTAMASGPVPLIMAWHGAGDTGSSFISATGLTSSASANACILVGADGYSRGWFVSSSEGWPGTDGYSNSLHNDLFFASKIRDEVGALYDVHTKKIYACGFSRGAAMSGLFATCCSNPGVYGGTWASPFAAYGVCAGYDAFGGTLDFSGVSPKRPVWLIHGTSDGVVPYSSGTSFASSLTADGFPATFTGVSGGPHTWLWSPGYGHSNQELVDYFLANPLP